MGISHHSSCALALSLLLYLTSLPPILPYTSFYINAYHNRPTDRYRPSIQTPVTPHTTTTTTTVTFHDAIQSYVHTRRRTATTTTQIQSSKSSSTNDDKRSSPPNNNNSPPPPTFVSVNIPTFLPDVTPSTARRAWLEYTWTRGGGLPVVVVPIVDGDGGEEGEDSYVRKRRLLPLFAEEELVDADRDGDGDGDAVVERGVGYRLTKLGPVWDSEIVAGSHYASVSFSTTAAATDGGTTAGTQMVWNVHYQTIRNQNLWQTVTTQFVQDASLNLASYLAPPIRLTVATRIPTHSSVIAAERWLEYVWWEGGGLPLPPPNPIKLDVDGIKRMIVPPFLIERLCSISINAEEGEETDANDDDDDDGARGDIQRLKEAAKNTGTKSPAGVVNLCYTVDNPGLLTYPAHTHFGEVRWGGEDKGEEGHVDMVWNVTVRPMNGFGPFVRFFTETVITVLARNLKVHMEMQSNDSSSDVVVDESYMVGIYPPRGINIGRFGKGGDPLFLVRKDIWVGSVLNAHLLDTRGVWEQSLDLFRPWRWGSTMVVDGEDDIIVEWTDSSSSASG